MHRHSRLIAILVALLALASPALAAEVKVAVADNVEPLAGFAIVARVPHAAAVTALGATSAGVWAYDNAGTASDKAATISSFILWRILAAVPRPRNV